MANDIYLGDYTNLTIDVMTNLYLYGTIDTPVSYENRLRSVIEYNNIPTVHIEMLTYMTSGPGRYAHASEASFVQKFFNNTPLPFALPDGSYTKSWFIDNFTVDFMAQGFSYDEATKKASAEFNIQIKHYTIDANSSDYATRTYIYNNASYTISSDAVFVVNGSNRYVQNMAAHAFDDNFDFNTADGISNLLARQGNKYVLKSEIDPYSIGRTVEIVYENKQNVPVDANYDITDFNAQRLTASNILQNGYLYPDAYNAMIGVVDNLKSVGTIDYTTADGKIIYGSVGVDVLAGTSGGDIIISGDGTDTLNGGGGNDDLHGGKGNDILTGGLGDDKFIINTGDGIDTILDREMDDRIMFNGTELSGVATSLGNGKYSLNGATLQQQGLDLLVTKDDTTGALIKEFFPTQYHGTENITKIGITIPGVNITGNNFKYYYGTEGNDFQNIVGGPNIIFGMGGDDRIYVSQYASYIDGGDGNDTIYGGSNTDTIIGGAGNDIIFSGAGADTINAGEGNDQIVSGAGGQTIDGGGGTNTIDYSSSITGVIVNLALATAQSGGAYSYATGDILSNIQKIIGTNSVDTFIGDANDNVFTGGGGADTINGGDGIDFISYATSNAAVNVNIALATTQSGGHAAGDLLSSIENLTGSNYNDTLLGSSIANIIAGGTGKDTITGGAGADWFKYSTVSDSGAASGVRDIITDFVEGTDKIDLGDFAGDFAFRGTSGFTEGAGVNYAQVASNTIIGIDADGNGILDFQIELTGLHTLAAGDFLL